MRLVREFPIDDVPSAIAAFLGIVPEKTWQKRIDNLRQQFLKNEFLRDFVEQEHVIEFAMDDVLQHYKQNQRFPSVIRTSGFFRLASFMCAFLSAYYASSPRAQTRLEGMLRSALKKEGFSSLEFELATAVHLSSQGFDVFFSDIEVGSGNDFIVTRNTIQFDVECKSVGPDIGKRVHSKVFRGLANSIATMLDRPISPESTGLILDIAMHTRVSNNASVERQLVGDVEEALSADENTTTGSVSTIRKLAFDIDQSPFMVVDGENPELIKEDCHQFVGDRLRISNPSLFFCISKRSQATVAVIRSREDDTMVASLSNQLSKAAKMQLSGRRPAALFVYFRGLDDDDLKKLKDAEGTVWADGTPLQRLATDLLIERPHLHTLAFMVPQSIIEARMTDRGGQSFLSSGHTYTFVNPLHPNAADKRFHLFPDRS
jgi:hypothetical protein